MLCLCIGVSWLGDDDLKLVRWGRTLWSDAGDLCALTSVAAGCDFPDPVAFSDLVFPNPLSFVGVLV